MASRGRHGGLCLGASFTVTGDGDLTGVYVAGRGLRLHLSSGYVYTYVYASTYSSPDTTVTLPTSCIDSTLDGADYSILSNGKTMPTGADIIAGNATVTGTLTASGTTKIASGAVAGHVLSCIDSSGTVIWSAPGAVVLVDDAVSSQKISEADGTSGQNTNGGTGVKRGHIQNYAIDQYKLDPGLLTGTSVGYGLVPIGAIVMWSGSAANIPLGWHLCDGNDGTPDLRDRFVLGAGATYAVGATGGSVSAAHTHAGPSHTHSVAAHEHGKGTLATRPSSAELGNVQGGTGAQANRPSPYHHGRNGTGGDGITGARDGGYGTREICQEQSAAVLCALFHHETMITGGDRKLKMQVNMCSGRRVRGAASTVAAHVLELNGYKGTFGGHQ